jgi:hypothetical protein
MMKQPSEHAPALQTPSPVQLVPSAAVLQAVTLASGLQSWHEFIGLTAPGSTVVAPIVHSVPQKPLWQVRVPLHAVPFATLLHVPPSGSGSHVWQTSFGLVIPLA